MTGLVTEMFLRPVGDMEPRVDAVQQVSFEGREQAMEGGGK